MASSNSNGLTMDDSGVLQYESGWSPYGAVTAVEKGKNAEDKAALAKLYAPDPSYTQFDFAAMMSSVNKTANNIAGTLNRNADLEEESRVNRAAEGLAFTSFTNRLAAAEGDRTLQAIKQLRTDDEQSYARQIEMLKVMAEGAAQEQNMKLKMLELQINLGNQKLQQAKMVNDLENQEAQETYLPAITKLLSEHNSGALGKVGVQAKLLALSQDASPVTVGGKTTTKGSQFSRALSVQAPNLMQTLADYTIALQGERAGEVVHFKLGAIDNMAKSADYNVAGLAIAAKAQAAGVSDVDAAFAAAGVPEKAKDWALRSVVQKGLARKSLVLSDEETATLLPVIAKRDKARDALAMAKVDKNSTADIYELEQLASSAQAELDVVANRSKSNVGTFTKPSATGIVQDMLANKAITPEAAQKALKSATEIDQASSFLSDPLAMVKYPERATSSYITLQLASKELSDSVAGVPGARQFTAGDFFDGAAVANHIETMGPVLKDLNETLKSRGITSYSELADTDPLKGIIDGYRLNDVSTADISTGVLQYSVTSSERKGVRRGSGFAKMEAALASADDINKTAWYAKQMGPEAVLQMNYQGKSIKDLVASGRDVRESVLTDIRSRGKESLFVYQGFNPMGWVIKGASRIDAALQRAYAEATPEEKRSSAVDTAQRLLYTAYVASQSKQDVPRSTVAYLIEGAIGATELMNKELARDAEARRAGTLPIDVSDIDFSSRELSRLRDYISVKFPQGIPGVTAEQLDKWIAGRSSTPSSAPVQPIYTTTGDAAAAAPAAEKPVVKIMSKQKS